MVVNEARMKQFIDKVYHEPFSLLTNNCFHKSIKVVRKAHELGLSANLVVAPISITPRRTFPYIPMVPPHCFVRLKRQKVDVARDPATEQIWCENNQIISIAPIDLPVNII